MKELTWRPKKKKEVAEKPKEKKTAAPKSPKKTAKTKQAPLPKKVEAPKEEEEEEDDDMDEDLPPVAYVTGDVTNPQVDGSKVRKE